MSRFFPEYLFLVPVSFFILAMNLAPNITMTGDFQLGEVEAEKVTDLFGSN